MWDCGVLPQDRHAGAGGHGRPRHDRSLRDRFYDLRVPSFDSVVDAYDAARPTYPAGVYDALGPLAGHVGVNERFRAALAGGSLRLRCQLQLGCHLVTYIY